jgi:hypothetical protein
LAALTTTVGTNATTAASGLSALTTTVGTNATTAANAITATNAAVATNATNIAGNTSAIAANATTASNGLAALTTTVGTNATTAANAITATNASLANFSSTSATGMAVIAQNVAANTASIAAGSGGTGGTGTGGGADQVQLDATTVIANNSVQYNADRSVAVITGDLNVKGKILGSNSVVSIGANSVQVVSGDATNGGFDRITTDGRATGGADLHLGGTTITSAGIQSATPAVNVVIDGNLMANKGIIVAAGQVIDAGNNKISNVATGVAATDAANVGQVTSAQANAVLAAQANTANAIAPVQKQLNGVQNQVNNLSNQVESNNRTALKGISGATAIAMMPPVAPGKAFSVGVGMGNFQGVSSLAVGVTAVVYENITFRAAATNNMTVGAGAGWSF